MGVSALLATSGLSSEATTPDLVFSALNVLPFSCPSVAEIENFVLSTNEQNFLLHYAGQPTLSTRPLRPAHHQIMPKPAKYHAVELPLW